MKRILSGFEFSVISASPAFVFAEFRFARLSALIQHFPVSAESAAR